MQSTDSEADNKQIKAINGPSHSEISPRLTREQPEISPRLAREQPEIGPRTARDWPENSLNKLCHCEPVDSWNYEPVEL